MPVSAWRATAALFLLISVGVVCAQTFPPNVSGGGSATGLPPRNPAPPAALPPAGTGAPAAQPSAQPGAAPAASTTAPAAGAFDPPGGNWRGPAAATTDPNARVPRTAADASRTSSPAGDSIAPIEPLKTIANSPRRPLTKVMPGPATLPNEQGQVWRGYDISPYTVRVTSTNRPEQAIVDWILRQTGYEAWHSSPLGILNVSPDHRTLNVYHTPEMHAVICDIVDRFVSSEAESQAFGLRVVTIGSPNWRAKAHTLLKPVPVQTQGIQAWIVQKEDAALMLSDMSKRLDYREHSPTHLVVNNGQSAVVSSVRPRSYTRDVILKPQGWPNYEPDIAQIEEGFVLELNPLLSIDGRTVDAVIRCNIDQIEKLVTVMLDVPSPAAPRQRAKIEVPQTSHTQLHEQFRWPTDQVLVVGLGVVATPAPTDPNPLLKNLPLISSPDRADLLVFVECKGKLTVNPAGPVGQRDAKIYHGRY